jgi:DNA-binding CsgD family transcriptional regulator
MKSRSVRITSLIIVFAGLILLALDIFLEGSINVALPLLFLILGGGFFIMVFVISPKWTWGVFLYIPGMLFFVFGLIFLLNTITNDYASWAYAWTLLILAVGVGILLSNYTNIWPPILNQIGWGMAITGIASFVIFGAIAGGLFIQVMAPLLLIIVGISIRFLHFEKILPEAMLQKLHIQLKEKEGDKSSKANDLLIEKLSSRELEVLHLINSGKTNQQIADVLSVAPSTVKSHINNIYSKLEVQTRVQAINRAREVGILEN